MQICSLSPAVTWPPSFSRPRVSNDNPYSESLFRTLKYCPQWPQDGFDSLDDTRIWVRDFMVWYNTVHRHSWICFVTPAQRYEGKDREILARLDTIYGQARKKRPERWSGETRNWNPTGTVYLNPERELTVVVKVAYHDGRHDNYLDVGGEGLLLADSRPL